MKHKIPLKKLKPCLGEAFDDLPDDGVALRRGMTQSRFEPKGERRAVQIVSTSAIDDYNTIIDVDGMDTERFRSNPVVLWGHRYNEPPIGSDRRLWAEEGKLYAETEYSNTARGQEIWTLKTEGHLRSHSITFAPVEEVHRGQGGWDKARDKFGFTEEDEPAIVYTRSVLLEHSDVSIGANAEALTIAVSKGLTVSPDLLRDLDIDPDSIPHRTVRRVKSRRTVRNVSAEIRTLLSQ